MDQAIPIKLEVEPLILVDEINAIDNGPQTMPEEHFPIDSSNVVEGPNETIFKIEEIPPQGFFYPSEPIQSNTHHLLYTALTATQIPTLAVPVKPQYRKIVGPKSVQRKYNHKINRLKKTLPKILPPVTVKVQNMEQVRVNNLGYMMCDGDMFYTCLIPECRKYQTYYLNRSQFIEHLFFCHISIQWIGYCYKCEAKITTDVTHLDREVLHIEEVHTRPLSSPLETEVSVTNSVPHPVLNPIPSPIRNDQFQCLDVADLNKVPNQIEEWALSQSTETLLHSQSLHSLPPMVPSMINPNLNINRLEERHSSPVLPPITKTNTSTPTTKPQCTICGKFISTPYRLKQHMSTHVKREKKFECHLCPKKFHWLTNLKYHVSTHTTDRSHKCLTCGSVFTTYRNLYEHMKRTHLSTYKQCEKCPYKTKYKRNFQEHVRKEHGITESVVEGQTRSLMPSSLGSNLTINLGQSEPITEPFNLGPNSNTIPITSLIAPPSVAPLKAPPSKPKEKFPCTICGKFLTCRYRLKQHMGTHVKRERKFECTLCPKKFYWRTNLTFHYSTHTDEKNFECSICKSVFKTQRSLHEHAKRIHFSDFVQCEMCEYKTKHKVNIKRHMKQVHGIVQETSQVGILFGPSEPLNIKLD